MNYPQDQLDLKKTADKHIQNPAAMQQTRAISFKDVVADVVRLKEILREETANMRDFNMEPVREIHEEKMQLIKKLEIQKQLFARSPELLSDKTEAEVENFKLIMSDMQELLEANYQEALKAKIVNDRVIGIVTKAVDQHRTRNAVYSQSGYRNNSVLGRSPQADAGSAVIVNQTI